jgi:hypothetical protein
MGKDFSVQLRRHSRKKVVGKTPASIKEEPKTLMLRSALKYEVSYVDYLLMTRLPRKVMDYLFKVHSELGIIESEPFPVDTFDLTSSLKKSATQLRGVLLRLKEKGFIRVHESRKNGARLISFSQNLFNSKKN